MLSYAMLSSLSALFFIMSVVFPSNITAHDKPENPPVTLIIHGSILTKQDIPRVLLFNDISLIDDAQKDKKVLCFEQNICSVPEGLHSFASLDERLHYKELASALSDSDPSQFNLDRTYFFGWHGIVFPRAAKSEVAESLYGALAHLITLYTDQYGSKPFLRIITVSHGQELLMRCIKWQGEQNKEKVDINELIALCGPVQEITKKYIHDDSIKRALFIHSHTDAIQVLDSPKLHFLRYESGNVLSSRLVPLFSDRHVDGTQKVVHAAVSWNCKEDARYSLCDQMFINATPEYMQTGEFWLRRMIGFVQFLQKMNFLSSRDYALYDRVINALQKETNGFAHGEFILPSFFKALPEIRNRLLCGQTLFHCQSNSKIAISVCCRDQKQTALDRVTITKDEKATNY